VVTAERPPPPSPSPSASSPSPPNSRTSSSPSPSTPCACRYLLDRLDQVYPLDFHVYRRRWHALAPGEEPGPLLGFLEWHARVSQWEERTAFAELLGEAAEGEQVEALRRVLLVEGREGVWGADE